MATQKSASSSSKSSEVLMEMEKKFAAKIYEPLPVVIAEGKGELKDGCRSVQETSSVSGAVEIDRQSIL